MTAAAPHAHSLAGEESSCLTRRITCASIATASVLVMLKGAIGVFRQSTPELLDHKLDYEARALIHIQFYVRLAANISLLNAHKVITVAEKRLLEAFPAADVIIHPDPDGHDEDHPSAFP